MKFHCNLAVSSDSGEFYEKSRGKTECIVLKCFIRAQKMRSEERARDSLFYLYTYSGRKIFKI